ncbi:MAG: hypothetical protein Fur0010_10030 [Bdellovibrio sp.]
MLFFTACSLISFGAQAISDADIVAEDFRLAIEQESISIENEVTIDRAEFDHYSYSINAMASSDQTALLAFFDDYEKRLLLGGTILAVMAFQNDRAIMDFVQDHRNSITSELSNIGERLGNNYPIMATGVGYILGVVFKNDRVKLFSIKLGKALVYSGLINRILKMSTSRVRPSSSNDPYLFGGFDISNNSVSFPSGHTTTAFAFATVIAEEFKDHKWVPFIAYGAAALAGWSRVHGEGDGRPAHWASDAIVGALIGHLVARRVTKAGKNEKPYLLIPSIDSHGSFSLQYIYRAPDRKVPEIYLFD